MDSKEMANILASESETLSDDLAVEFSEQLIQALSAVDLLIRLPPADFGDDTFFFPMLLPVDSGGEVLHSLPQWPTKFRMQDFRQYTRVFKVKRMTFDLMSHLQVRVLERLNNLRGRVVREWQNGLVAVIWDHSYLRVECDNASSIYLSIREAKESPAGRLLHTFHEVLESVLVANAQSFVICTNCLSEGRLPTERGICSWTLPSIQRLIVQGVRQVECSQSNMAVLLNNLCPDQTVDECGLPVLKVVEDEETVAEDSVGIVVKEKIAQGGAANIHMGKVVGESNPFPEKFVMKLFHPDEQDAFDDDYEERDSIYSELFGEFRREVLIQTTIRHPRIIRLFAVTTSPLGMMVEFMEWGSLHE
jgi:hypothetical protein